MIKLALFKLPLLGDKNIHINSKNPKTTEELWLLIDRVYSDLKNNPKKELSTSYVYYLNEHFIGSTLESKYNGKPPEQLKTSYTPISSDSLDLHSNKCIQALVPKK